MGYSSKILKFRFSLNWFEENSMIAWMRLFLTKICFLFGLILQVHQKSDSSCKNWFAHWIKYSEQRGDVSLQAYLETQSKKNPPGKVLVHANCRHEKTDPKWTKCRLSKGFCYLFVCLLHSKYRAQIIQQPEHLDFENNFSCKLWYLLFII